MKRRLTLSAVLVVFLANRVMGQIPACMGIQPSTNPEPQPAVFKADQPMMREGNVIVRGFIMYFIKKRPVTVQIWKTIDEANHIFKLMESYEVMHDDTIAEEKYDSNGYRKIFELNTPYPLAPEDQLGVFSNVEIPINAYHTNDNLTRKFSDSNKKLQLVKNEDYTFDGLQFPYRFQICPCFKPGCSEYNTEQKDQPMESALLTEKRTTNVVTVVGPAGPPGNRGPKGPKGEDGKNAPKSGASISSSNLLTEETLIGIMLWLGVLTLLMIVVLAVLMVICVGNRRNTREKTRLNSHSDSTQNFKEANGDWNDPSWHGDNNAI